MKVDCYHEHQFENFLWIDILKPDKESLIEIANKHQLDYYLIQDSLQPGHLPKFEKHPDYNFLILRAFTSEANYITNITELSNKIAFFYNDRKLITVHRTRFPFLDNLPKDFESTQSLLLAIIHRMISSFQGPLQKLDANIDELEKRIFLGNLQDISLEDLYYQKTQSRITKKLLVLSQSAFQMLDVEAELKPAHHDIKDDLVRLILDYDEVLESAHHLLNTFLSVNAQKNNDVMKLLTVFSAFFLPLTFIAGIYGMNFEYMPELHHPYAYFTTLVLMVALSIFIFFWFKRKKIL
jgi:magnesium transporter